MTMCLATTIATKVKRLSIGQAFYFGTGGRIRTYEGESRQIYSLLCLTAPQPQRMEPPFGLEPKTCCLQNSCSNQLS